MEADGIIVRTVYAEIPPRVEYSLSKLGDTMRPILDAMEKWENDYSNVLLIHNIQAICKTALEQECLNRRER